MFYHTGINFLTQFKSIMTVFLYLSAVLKKSYFFRFTFGSLDSRCLFLTYNIHLCTIYFLKAYFGFWPIFKFIP